MLGTELSYMNNFSSDLKSKIINIFVFWCTSIIMLIICSCICQKRFRYIQFTLSFCVEFFRNFAIYWLFSSLYATLLYSLAYPIYVIILFTLHVTIFIVTIIIFAAFVPNVISGWNKYTRVLQRFIFICCITIGFVTLIVDVSAIYVAVISAFGSTIVERIFPQDGIVQALLLLPSLFVFLGVWLLQRKVFSK